MYVIKEESNHLKYKFTKIVRSQKGRIRSRIRIRNIFSGSVSDLAKNIRIRSDLDQQNWEKEPTHILRSLSTSEDHSRIVTYKIFED
jgi:hypothetical protein